MQVDENSVPADELKKKKRRKRKQSEEGDSIVDDGCLWDGCFFVSWMPWDFDGCNFDIGDGCSFDGCSMIFMPFRLMIIFGLMLFGDWDYKRWTMKDR